VVGREIVLERKLQLMAGQADIARIAQSVGPTGVSVVAVKEAYDAATRRMSGTPVPATLQVRGDGTFDLHVLAPAAATLLASAAGVNGGSGRPATSVAGTVRRSQVRDIARTKLPELNTNDLDAAERIIAGTARSMGLTVVDDAGATP
jgi:large subunit ribosomal protein L11